MNIPGIAIPKRSLTNHLLGILYVVAVGYQVIIREFSGQYYFFYYYSQEYMSEARSSNLFILPVGFTAITVLFGLLFYWFQIERSALINFRRLARSGFLIYLFILLLTLQEETKEGAFFLPLINLDFPNKTEYVQSVILISFFGFYYLGFKSFFHGISRLGRFDVFLFYAPFIPFLYGVSPTIHLILLLITGLIFCFYTNSRLTLDPILNFITKHKILICLCTMFTVAMVFRLWTIRYLENFTTQNVAGMIADGPASYGAALGFLAGEQVHSGVPYSYSLLFAGLLKITGFQFFDALTLQALLNALTPLIVFFTCYRVFNFKVAVLALVCSALSYELLYFSVMVHRTGFANLFTMLSMFLLIHLVQELKLKTVFALGFVLGWAVLLEGHLAPLFVLVLIPLIGNSDKKQMSQYISVLLLGLIISQISFNWFVYKDYKTIVPLGRFIDLQHRADLFTNWLYGGNAITTRIRETGFNPFDHPSKSFQIFLNDPLKLGGLLVKKFCLEVKAYLMGRNAVFLDPLLLNQESFFSCALTFFYLPIFFLGLTGFVLSKSIHWKYKAILAGPFFYHFCFHTIIAFSYARYRGIILPLMTIFFAWGLYLIYQFLDSKEPDSQSFYREKPISQKFIVSNRIGLYFLLCIGVFFLDQQISVVAQPPYSKTTENPIYSASHAIWKNVNNQKTDLLFLPNQQLTHSFTTPKKGTYDLFLKVARAFRPVRISHGLEFFLNDVPLRSPVKSIRSGWIVFNQVELKERINRFSVKISDAGKVSPSIPLGTSPKNEHIKLSSFYIASS